MFTKRVQRDSVLTISCQADHDHAKECLSNANGIEPRERHFGDLGKCEERSWAVYKGHTFKASQAGIGQPLHHFDLALGLT